MGGVIAFRLFYFIAIDIDISFGKFMKLIFTFRINGSGLSGDFVFIAVVVANATNADGQF